MNNMSSLIPGYEYDIFINYRQKDNIHDGWVSEFVDALKTELESIYYDQVIKVANASKDIIQK
jgi:hypothetical protein